MVIAARDVGVRELPGIATHPRIAEYYRHAHDVSPDSNDDDTSWCSAAMSCWIDEAGYLSPNTARARRWLGWGEVLTEPRFGCIIVLSRGNPSGTKGHVAFYCGPAGNGRLHLLGGNQRNSVRFDATAYSSESALGYRWPKQSDQLLDKPTV